MTFAELNEQDKILAIKDTLILLFRKVVIDPSTLKNYINPEEQSFKTVEEFISKVGRKKECYCFGCIDFSAVNAGIPSELEPLIDAAKKQAETRDY